MSSITAQSLLSFVAFASATAVVAIGIKMYMSPPTGGKTLQYVSYGCIALTLLADMSSKFTGLKEAFDNANTGSTRRFNELMTFMTPLMLLLGIGIMKYSQK
jgi:hypothetical protein